MYRLEFILREYDITKYIFKDFNNQTGTVEVKAFGTCLQYPKAFITIQKATLNLLKFYLPEVTSVQSCESETKFSKINSQVTFFYIQFVFIIYIFNNLVSISI